MKCHRLVSIAVVAGLGAMGGANNLPAQADVPVARAGQRIDGALAASDPFFKLVNDSIRVKSYRFDPVKGRLYRVAVSSPDSDIQVLVARQVAATGLTAVLKADHHLLGGSISRVVFRATEAGPYLLVVGASHQGTGPFSLQVAELPVIPPTVHAVAVGQTVTGVLDERDATAEETGTHYTIYELQGRKGVPFRLSMTETGFDGRLAFGQVRASGEWHEIDHADQGGEGDPEALTVNPPDDGGYQIRVAAVGTVDGGPFTLTVAEAPRPRTTPETHPIVAGTDVNGRLDETDVLDSLGYRYDYWMYSARAGEHIVIRLVSDSFDTYLRVGRMSPGGFYQLAHDDDGGGGTNSRLDMATVDSGQYVVRVSSETTRKQEGAYRLRIDRTAERPPAPLTPKSRTIAIGQEETATLDDSDARLTDGSPYQHWTFSAAAGDRVVITMRSKALDAVLMVGQMAQGQFKEIWRDDDGGGGKDARVVMVAPQAGQYVIRTNTFGPAQKGEYTLKVERSAP
jgi:hypothetical protein